MWARNRQQEAVVTVMSLPELKEAMNAACRHLSDLDAG